MNPAIYYIFPTLLLLVYFWTSYRLKGLVHGFALWNTSAATRIAFAVCVFVSILTLTALNPPLPFFYLSLYGVILLSDAFHRDPSATSGALLPNTRYLVFAATHLAVLGALALAAGANVAEVLSDPGLRMFCLGVALACDDAFLILIRAHFEENYLVNRYWESPESRLFARFVWFCVVSVTLDSISCLFQLPTVFPLYFLSGSNALLLAMAFLFARHVYIITKNASVKDEARRLLDVAAEHLKRAEALEQTAHLDALTGIYNRQYALSNMCSMLKSGEAFSIAFFDLDRLKQVNDRGGHAAGDAYLIDFCRNIKRYLRPNDIFARYGGDEFVVSMPDVREAEALELFGRIQKDADAEPPEGFGAPFSFGTASSRNRSEKEIAAFLSHADRAMYRDKQRRRGEEEGV